MNVCVCVCVWLLTVVTIEKYQLTTARWFVMFSFSLKIKTQSVQGSSRDDEDGVGGGNGEQREMKWRKVINTIYCVWERISL